jgi:hypothetical protein
MTIDRRSFVQSAAAAVGGAASVAADAAAETRLQIAQAGPLSFPTASPVAAIPPGPYKPDYTENVGDQSQRYYLFLKDLFASSTLRDEIWGMTDPQVRDLLLNRLGLNLSYGNPKTQILIVDIGKGRARFTDPNLCSVTGCAAPTGANWYTLVLPPLPLGYKKQDGSPEDGYLKEMTWESAWHHAIVYGYGM